MKFLYTILFSFLAFSSMANDFNVVVYSEYTAVGYVFYATNNEDFPVEIDFTFELNNLKVRRAMDGPIIVPPKRSNVRVLSLVPIRKLADYSYEFSHTVSQANEGNIPSSGLITSNDTESVSSSQTTEIDRQNSVRVDRKKLAEERRLLKIEKTAALNEKKAQRAQDRERLSNEREALAASERELEKQEQQRLDEIEAQAKHHRT